MAVCHLPLETILSLPPAISRPRSPHPHSPCLPRSLPRTLAAHLGLRSAVGPATTTAAVQIDPSVAFECTSQSPGKGCCDERLNPPKLSRSKIESWLEQLAKAPPRVRSRKGDPQKHRDVDASPEGVRRRRESANRVLTVLKAALNLAYQHGNTRSRAAWESVKPYRDVAASKIRYLNDSESQQLVQACEIPFRDLVTGALLT